MRHNDSLLSHTHDNVEFIKNKKWVYYSLSINHLKKTN